MPPVARRYSYRTYGNGSDNYIACKQLLENIPFLHYLFGRMGCSQ